MGGAHSTGLSSGRRPSMSFAEPPAPCSRFVRMNRPKVDRRSHRARNVQAVPCASSVCCDTLAIIRASGPPRCADPFNRHVPSSAYAPQMILSTFPSRSVTRPTSAPSTGHRIDVIPMGSSVPSASRLGRPQPDRRRGHRGCHEQRSSRESERATGYARAAEYSDAGKILSRPRIFSRSHTVKISPGCRTDVT